MATKPRARRKASADNPASSLIAALKFIEPAQKKIGTHEQQFCMMRNHWVVAFDGVLTIATKIVEDLNACPHTLQLLDALSKCKDELTLAQVSNVCLSVKSGAFNALIQCVDELEIAGPDPQCALIDDRVKTAFDAVLVLATENAPNAVHASVLLQAGSCVATNGHALVEYWHGLDLPPNLLVPRQAATAVVKSKKPLTGFGFSQSSVTFYFDDGSFIKTQLYKANYPDYLRIMNVPTNPFPLPHGFFSAVHAIESFNENGTVYFHKGIMSAGVRQGEATTYKVEGLTEDMAFNSKYLIMLELCIKTADFRPDEKRMFFFGDNARGAIMGMDLGDAKSRIEEEKEQTEDEETTYINTLQPGERTKEVATRTPRVSAWSDLDDDIPF